MNRASEVQYLSVYRWKSYRETEAYMIYKACVAVANNGLTLDEEKDLHIEELLKVACPTSSPAK